MGDWDLSASREAFHSPIILRIAGMGKHNCDWIQVEDSIRGPLQVDLQF